MAVLDSFNVAVLDSLLLLWKRTECGCLGFFCYDFDSASYGAKKVTERYWAPTLLITDHIAVFSASNDSHIDGGFSRCSTNALDLVKIDGNWKVGNSSRTGLLRKLKINIGK